MRVVESQERRVKSQIPMVALRSILALDPRPSTLDLAAAASRSSSS